MKSPVFAALLSVPVLLFSSSLSRAFDIRFSTEEGYPPDNAPLNATPAGKPVWHTSEGGFIVNGKEKSATANPAGDAATALLSTPIPLAPGQTAIISADFEFASPDVSLPAPEAGIHVPSISLGSSPDTLFQGTISLLLGHFSWSGNELSLQANPGGQAVHFSAGDLGIEGSGKPSDRLRLTIELTKGKNASEWSYQVTLLNVTKNLAVGTISASDVTVPQALQDSPDIYLNLNRGTSADAGGPASVKFFAVSAH